MTILHLVGNIQRIVVRREANICLLLSVRSENHSLTVDPIDNTRHLPDERVHLGCLHIVELLHSILDLTLVRSNVNNEHQRVVLLNLFHRRLRVQGSAISTISTIPLFNIFPTTHETIVRNSSILGA